MFSFLNNISPVTKNLLLLNVFFFLAANIIDPNVIDLNNLLSGHYFNSPLFKPFQIITHFFMHADIRHIFFNMFGLVIFGSFLESRWGAKRFFIFYFASALGSIVLFNSIGVYEIYQLKKELTTIFTSVQIDEINGIISHGGNLKVQFDSLNSLLTNTSINQAQYDVSINYLLKCNASIVGASGAVFGIMAAFAILFPNTEMMLMFIPFPIKAKFLVGGYFVYEVIQTFSASATDNVAHLAHVGGAIVGAVMVLYWRKFDNKNFW